MSYQPLVDNAIPDPNTQNGLHPSSDSETQQTRSAIVISGVKKRLGPTSPKAASPAMQQRLGLRFDPRANRFRFSHGAQPQSRGSPRGFAVPQQPRHSRSLMGNYAPRRNYVVSPRPPTGSPRHPAGSLLQSGVPVERTTFLPPSVIKYTSNKISPTFEDGTKLVDLFDQLAQRKLRKRDVPMISVVLRGNHFWAVDNRRLAVFRELHRRHLCKVVKVKVVRSLNELPPEARHKFQPGFDLRKLIKEPDGLPEGWGRDGDIGTASSGVTAPENSPSGVTTLINGDEEIVFEEEIDFDREDLYLDEVPLLERSEDAPYGTAAGSTFADLARAASPTPSEALTSSFSQTFSLQSPKRLFAVSEDERAGTSTSIVKAPKLDLTNASAGVEMLRILEVKQRTKPLASYFLGHYNKPKALMNPKPSADGQVGVYCGCGVVEGSLSELSVHKDRKGHWSWKGPGFDTVRHMCEKEDLRINC